MVGRLIVGESAGPGSRAFGWFEDDPAKSQWKAVPEAARDTLPAIDEIMTNGVVGLLQVGRESGTRVVRERRNPNAIRRATPLSDSSDLCHVWSNKTS